MRNYEKYSKPLSVILTTIAVLVFFLIQLRTERLHAQSDGIEIIGIDASSYPRIQLTVKADGLVIDEQTQSCPLTIEENNQDVITPQVDSTLLDGKRATRIAFLLDLTTYEMELNIEEAILASLQRFVRLCNWQADDQYALYAPGRNGKELEELIGWRSLSNVNNRRFLITQTQAFDESRAADGYLIITDVDDLIAQIIGMESDPFADTTQRNIIVVFSNGMDTNGIDFVAMQDQLRERAIDLYVILGAAQDSERSLANIAELINNNVGRYFDLRNTDKIDQLWLHLINPDIRYQLLYTSTSPPPSSISVKGNTLQGKVTSLVKPVLADFQPYKIELTWPLPGTVIDMPNGPEPITATVSITYPTFRHQRYPYTLEYRIDNQPYQLIQAEPFTVFVTNHVFHILSSTIASAITPTIASTATATSAVSAANTNRSETKVAFGSHRLSVRVIEERTGLSNVATTSFEIRQPEVSPRIQWPERSEWFKWQSWLTWGRSVNDYLRTKPEILFSFIVNIILVVLVLSSLALLWRWLQRYYLLDLHLETAQDEVRKLQQRLSFQQSTEQGRSTQFWPSPPEVMAELILLQGEGKLYDYIALSKQRTILGARSTFPSGDNDEFWLLENPWVDDVHCVIDIQRNEVWIFDGDGIDSNQPSRNGLFVNGKQVGPEGTKLKNGDVIGLSPAVKYSFRTRHTVNEANQAATDGMGRASSAFGFGYEDGN